MLSDGSFDSLGTAHHATQAEKTSLPTQGSIEI